MWFEEYIVSPPTHILNGFIWAAWGVYDYFLANRGRRCARRCSPATDTHSAQNLDRYDLGFWSLYEQSGTWLPMMASPFYHRFTSSSCGLWIALREKKVRSSRRSMGRLHPEPRQTRARALSTRAHSSFAITRRP